MKQQNKIQFRKLLLPKFRKCEGCNTMKTCSYQQDRVNARFYYCTACKEKICEEQGE